MNHELAIRVFAALAHDHRLALVRQLIRGGSAGVSAGGLATALQLPPATASFHLNYLVNAGVVRRCREGRTQIYCLDMAQLRGVLDYLTAHCCVDHAAACDLSPHPLECAMSDSVFNVLFLCTGNSARSVMAEALLNHWGKDRFRAYSAGSQPKGEIHPMTLQLLERLKFPTDGLRSKSWDEFATPDAPPLNFVFTVCDNARGEACPLWPGQPIVAHWGVDDPAAAEGTEAQRMQAFREAFRLLEARIKAFASLRPKSLERVAIQKKVDDIGQMQE